MTTELANPPDILTAALERWHKQVELELKGVPFAKKLVTRTPEGIALQPLYTMQDRAAATDEADIPGVFPGRRGRRAFAAGERGWEIAQRLAAPDVGTFNRWLRAALMAGQDSVVLSIDRAGRAGLDADQADPEDIGREGLSLLDLSEFAAAMEGVDLTAVPLQVDAGESTLAIAAVVVAWARYRAVPLESLRGSLTADPLGMAVRRGKVEESLPRRWDEQAEWVKWALAKAPGLRTVGVDGRVWHEAGASAVQELAYVLASAVESLRELSARGLSVANVASRMAVTFAIGPQFFTELAKFRAWRILWARALAAAGEPAAALDCFVTAESGGRNKSKLDVQVNLLRASTEGLSAVLGGVDAMHLAPHDAVSGGTDERARRVARNLHVLLAEEFHLTDTADVAGGSWYIESMTDELARAAWTQFQCIEAQGGMAAAIASGGPQARVAESALAEAASVAHRRRGIVGTNIFPNPRDTMAEPDEAAVSAMREARAALSVRRRGDALGMILPKGATWKMRFEAAVLAARDGATLGQLAQMGVPSSASRRTFFPQAVPRRIAEPLEAMRRAVAAMKTPPALYLARLGPVKQHKARADFASAFFSIGGFVLGGREIHETAEAAAQAVLASGVQISVLCSSDDAYLEAVPRFAAVVKAGNPTITVVLAGMPADAALMQRYRGAGVDEFIHIKANALEINYRLLAKLGVNL